MGLVELVIWLIPVAAQCYLIFQWRAAGILELKLVPFIIALIILAVVPGAATVGFIIAKLAGVLSVQWWWIIPAVALDYLRLSAWGAIIGKWKK